MLEIPGILDVGWSRRRFLHASAYGALAAALNQSRLSATGSKRLQPIQSCIMLMLYGGPSHLDTWDMKPHAPSEIRGEYRPIRSSVPGQVVCEHLPAFSKVADHTALVRAMHHELTNHNSAMYQALIGREPTSNNEILGADRSRDFPNCGATLSYAAANGQLPAGASPLTSVALPHVLHNVVDLPGQNAGFLGARFDPMQIIGDPNQPNFEVRNLSLPGGVSEGRMNDRRALRQILDRQIGSETDGSELDDYQQKAFDLLHSDTVKTAFSLDRETDNVRDRYGRSKLGQSLLLSRRLVESGVRFINVHDGVRNGQNANWDSHATIFPRHRELLAPLDVGLSALIEDLDERGLLDSTLVIVMGEFGRTPRINTNGGRDHWPNCYTALLAGGGITGGATYGASDRNGAYPQSHPVTPGDLAATIFWRFGLNPLHEITDLLDRPFPMAAGEPIESLFSSLG